MPDRDNGRIQRFDLSGKYLGESPNLGRIYSLEITHGHGIAALATGELLATQGAAIWWFRPVP